MDRRTFLGPLGVGAVATALGAAADGAAAEPVADTVDVLVAGGSATGVLAAIRAAEQGARVALVANNTYFGGMATAALVPVWHSLYSTDGRRQIIGGLTERIEKMLLARGEAEMHDPSNPSVGCTMNVAGLQIVLDELVGGQKGIRVFLGARVVAAVCDRPGHLTHAVIEDKSGRRRIAARAFVDATGDADLAVQAGFRTWTLPRSDIQAHTLCAILAHEPDIRRAHPGFSFAEIMKPRRGAGLDHVFQWQAPIIGAKELTFLAATRVSGRDPSVADDLTAANLEARRQIRRIVDAVNREFPMPEGKRLALVALAPQLGVRESRHIEAEYRVTGEDVLEGRRFDDCVARGSYRVDIHEGRGIVFRYLNGEEHRMVATDDGDIRWEKRRWKPEGAPCATWYEIPLRALLPRGSENLVCAGRMLDCSREAYGALRVMVNCNQMGEAAGLQAARWARS